MLPYEELVPGRLDVFICVFVLVSCILINKIFQGLWDDCMKELVKSFFEKYPLFVRTEPMALLTLIS